MQSAAEDSLAQLLAPAAFVCRCFLAAALWLCSGCNTLPLQQFSLGELGHFEYRRSESARASIVVGVPHGRGEPGAVDYGEWISQAIGAGLVIGYDFGAKRVPVAQPLVHQSPISWPAERRGSVYPEFKKLLRETVAGPIQFYVGVRVADGSSGASRIEVASAGFSFEQLLALKAAFGRLRDGIVGASPELARVEMAIYPLEDISWKHYGVRNHGVLLLAQRGLVLRLPKMLADAEHFSPYREILAGWIKESLRVADDRYRLPAFTIEQTTHGRIDSIGARKPSRGIVLGAPHGSFDWYTGELVEELSYRTGLPAAITRGFTPTEANGWRINVNRPTERRYPTDGVGRRSERAQAVFSDYAQTLATLARGPLELYIELHQSGPLSHIDVATVGLTKETARSIKNAYRDIRNEVLAAHPKVSKVELLIEPLDSIEIGAWAAKDQGALKLAKTALHFELPAYRVLQDDRTRRVYTQILAELVGRIVEQRRASDVNN